jgi:hypothetical protein
MNSLIKALLPGALLSWLVSTFVGSEGSTGGVLNIERITLYGHSFLWSWMLFFVGAGLAWALFAMMD